MHIRQLTIENVKGFVGQHVLDFGPGDLAGWWVLAGRNGAGKTTALRALALPLVGLQNAAVLTGGGADWRTEGSNQLSQIIVTSSAKSGAGRRLKFKDVDGSLRGDAEPAPNLTLVGLGAGRNAANDAGEQRWSRPAQRLATLFGHGHGAEPISFLQFKHAQALEGHAIGAEIRDGLIALLNDGLLPDGVRVTRVTTEGLWIEQAGTQLRLESLPDGYRAAITLVVEIARWLHDFAVDEAMGDEKRATATMWGAEAVVLIDEVEDHLHVSWQQRIGGWLCAHFPRTQFIVTTHSPFICQSVVQVGKVRGGLFSLPAPATDGTIQRITGNEFWMVAHGGADEAVMTSLFGLESPHSLDSDEHRRRLGLLQGKLMSGEATDEEMRRYHTLLARAPAPGMAQLRSIVDDLKARP